MSGQIWVLESQALSARINKLIVTIYSKMCNKMQEKMLRNKSFTNMNQASPDRAAGSMSRLVFWSSQVRFPGIVHSFISCLFLVKVSTEYWFTA